MNCRVIADSRQWAKCDLFFGIEVEYEMGANQLKISQSTCITRMVEKFNQVDAKTAYNPSVEGQIMVKCERKDPRIENRPFRSLVGSLLYVATGTRPEIAFAVSIELKSGETKQKHWNVAICLLRYLKLTLISGICYQGKRGVLKMNAYSDADRGSKMDNRCSTSGVMVIINKSPVICKSKLQQDASLGPTKDKYVALSLCIQEVLWSKNILL